MDVLTTMKHVDLTIGRGEKHSWAKESEDAWTTRVLGLDDASMYTLRAIAVSDENALATVALHFIDDREHTLFEVAIPKTRAYALLSWARGKVFGLKNRVDECVYVVIVAHDGSAILLQRKDQLHPNHGCRGRLAPFGGAMIEYESPREAAMRKLYEELRDPNVADEIVKRMVIQKPMFLSGVQWPGGYTAHWMMSKADDADQFERWRSKICESPGLAESDSQCLTRTEFVDLYHEDHVGSHFVSSTQELIARVLQKIRAERLHAEIDDLKERAKRH